jgi:hypothetical protein
MKAATPHRTVAVNTKTFTQPCTYVSGSTLPWSHTLRYCSKMLASISASCSSSCASPGWGWGAQWCGGIVRNSNTIPACKKNFQDNCSHTCAH